MLRLALTLIVLGMSSHLTWCNTDSLRLQFNNSSLSDSLRFERGIDLVIAQFRVNMDSARSSANELLNFAQERHDRDREATAIRILGNTHAMQGEFEEAEKYFLKSLELLEHSNDSVSILTTTNNLGTVYYEKGDYTRAQKYLLRSLRMAEELDDKSGISRALNNLGNVHNDLRNNEEALQYYQRSLEVKEQLGQRHLLPSVYNNIGLVHSNLRDHQEALKALQKSAEVAIEVGDKRGESRAYGNIGTQYYQLGEPAKALEFFNRSIDIKTSINDWDGLTSAYVSRGQHYVRIKNYHAAIADCRKSLTGSEESGAVNIQKESCFCLSLAYEGLGRTQDALDHWKRFQVLKDSLFNKERTQEITRAEMNYAFEKQLLADSIEFHRIQTEQQVAHQQELNAGHRRFFITLILVLILISAMVFLYWKHRQDLKMKVLENQMLNSEIEYKKKDLTTLAMNISNNQQWAESLAERLKVLKESTGRKRAKELEKLESEINNHVWVNKDSEEFYRRIDELSSAFYDRLTTRFPGLTKTDIRLCSLIKLDLNTKQIAALQNINPSSVKMSRNRLRKKLDLTPEHDLHEFLRSL